MIIGMGNDLCDIRRVEKTIARFGPRFIERVFTPEERAIAESRRAKNLHIAAYAKRWAAKEACAKALGLGIDHGVYLRDIGVVNDAAGRPSIILRGGAATRLQAITPEGHRTHIHVSLSDEPPFSLAHIVIEAVPAG